MARRVSSRILLIDTEPFLGETLAAKLSKAGFSVAQAPSCQEAVLLLEAFTVDMVILGHVSEESLEMCRQFRHLFPVPIIMIGKDPSKEIWEKALVEANAEFYVKSPFSMDLLVSRIKAILRRCLPQTTGAIIRPG